MPPRTRLGFVISKKIAKRAHDRNRLLELAEAQRAPDPQPQWWPTATVEELGGRQVIEPRRPLVVTRDHEPDPVATRPLEVACRVAGDQSQGHVREHAVTRVAFAGQVVVHRDRTQLGHERGHPRIAGLAERAEGHTTISDDSTFLIALLAMYRRS